MAKRKPKAEPAGGWAPVNEVADAKKSRKERASFYTPLALVAKLVEWADLHTGMRVLEPSAGDGRIVHALREFGVTHVDVCELEPAMHERIRAAGGTLVGTDFLEFAAGTEVGSYDRIVMNPPFHGREWEKHLEAAWGLLAPGGLILCVAPDSARQRMDRCKPKLTGCAHATYEQLPADLFAESGAKVSTVVIEVREGAGDPVCGFKNGATWNAALMVTNDCELYRMTANRSWGLDARIVDAVRDEIGKSGGSCYGIDWREVAEYRHQDEPVEDVVMLSDAALARLDDLFEELGVGTIEIVDDGTGPGDIIGHKDEVKPAPEPWPEPEPAPVPPASSRGVQLTLFDHDACGAEAA